LKKYNYGAEPGSTLFTVTPPPDSSNVSPISEYLILSKVLNARFKLCLV